MSKTTVIRRRAIVSSSTWRNLSEVADAGHVLRGALRSGVFGAAVEGAIGTIEGGFALFDGHTFDAASRHVVRKVGGGFVVGTAATMAAEAAAVLIGVGFPAVVGGLLGGVVTAKIVGRVLGPSPLEATPEPRRKTRSTRKNRSARA
jgi:hypothetical protein